MNIYVTRNQIPYTYLIGWSKLDVWYYGVRYSVSCRPSDLWKSYFTSSTHVKDFREKNGDPDIIQIRKTFHSSTAAREWEDKVIRRMRLTSNPKWLNKSRGYGPQNLEATVVVKILGSNTCFIVTKREFDSNENLVGAMKGVKNIKLSEQKKGKPSNTIGLTNEKRIERGLAVISGRPKGSKDSPGAKQNRSASRKGKVLVRRANETKSFLVDMNDPLIDIEYYRILVNDKPCSNETKEKIRNSLTGIERTKEHCDNLSKGMLKRYENPEEKRKTGEAIAASKSKNKKYCFIHNIWVDTSNFSRWHSKCINPNII